MTDKKTEERSLSGMGRHPRFAEVEHAENAGVTLRRLLAYFAEEKLLVLAMLSVVIVGTLCGIYAPSLQSQAVDMLAGCRSGSLFQTVIWMLAVYLLYSVGQLAQSLISAHLSQRIVKKMRKE